LFLIKNGAGTKMMHMDKQQQLLVHTYDRQTLYQYRFWYSLMIAKAMSLGWALLEDTRGLPLGLAK
jgi:hypothetical protein